MGIATNYEAHENTVKSMSDQQIMQGMQNPNPSGPPPFMLLVEANTRKEMRDEQTRQEGLGQPTVLEGLMGAAPAPTPQTNVAGMPQDVASGMAQSMAPKTDTTKNTGIATMASGGILKMAPGGAVNQVIVTFAEDSPIYPGETRRMTQDTLEAMPRNSVQDVKGVADVGGVEAAKKVPYLPMSGGLKRQLKTIESESFPLIDTSDRNNVPPDNYGVSASLPPADGAMYSSPTGGQGGNTDPSRLGLPKDEFSQVPVSSMSTPVGLATLAAAGDADVRDEVVVGDTSTLSEKELRKQADNRNEAGRARFELMRALEATNSKGQPGGTLGKRYAESGDDLRMVDAQRYIESLIKGDPYSGELSPSQTERNQKTLSDTLRREEVARQRADITEAGKIAQDAADTRKAFSVPLESNAVETVSAGEIKPNPFAVSKAPFNATSDEAAKESVSQARVTADEPGTELAETAGRPASNAQLEAFTDAAALRNTALTVPTKPKVFDALEDIRFQELLVNDSPDNQTPVEQILVDQIKKLKTPQEQIAAIKLASDKHTIAQKAEVAARKELAEAEKTDTGVYRAEKKLEVAQKETNRIERAAPWVLEDNFGIKRAFGPEVSKLVEAQAADNLQATAVADVAKVTANENYPVSPVEVRRRLRAMKDKDVDADERFDLAETRLDAERAAGLTAGKNAFVAPSSADPTSNAALTAKLVEQMKKKDAPVSDDTRLDPYLYEAGQQGRAIGAAANYKPTFQDRFKTASALEKEARADRVGDTLQKAADATQVVTGVSPEDRPDSQYVFDTDNMSLTDPMSLLDVKLEDRPGPAKIPEAAFNSQEMYDILAKAAETTKKAAGTTANTTAALLGGGANYFDFDADGSATTPSVTKDFMVPSGAGDANITLPFSYDEPPKTDIDTSKNAAEILEKLPLLDQSVKNGNVVTPATRTGIATIGGSGATSRSEGQPNTSSYEQKLLDILDKREKSADQDKWLGLAEMGMRLMASSNPNMLSAIGEAGLGASQTFLGNKRKAEAQEMDVLSKLSALEARKQIADDANRTRLQAAGISASGRSPAGMVTNKVRLSETAKQIKAVQASLDGYRGSNLSSTQAQEKSKLEDQLKTLNAEYTSLYNNQGSILGNALAEANTPVNLSK